MKKTKYILSYAYALILAMSAVGQNRNTPVEGISPTWHWRCTGGDTTLNFNPAMTVDSIHPILFDSIPYADDYTIIIVYKPVICREATLWRLSHGDSQKRGLTTEHIVSGTTKIRYSDTTDATPIINTMRQTAPDSTAPFARLTIGGDSLGGRVKVAEVLYFDRRLGNTTLRRIQSALAVRYGVTLGPTDYFDGREDTIWRYVDDGRWHHRVTGVGCDSTYGTHQLRSRSEMEGALLTICTDSMAEGTFLVCGDDNGPLVFEGDGCVDLLQRHWKTNGVNTDDYYFTLVFDIREIEGSGDSLVLLVGDRVYRPDRISAGQVSFSDVAFPTDTCTFTLARGSIFWQMAQATWNSGTADASTHTRSQALTIYPNPTTGKYNIEVVGAAWVEVNIYNTHGVLVESRKDTDKNQYHFAGYLPAGNTYYANVMTDNGTQTIKLVVK